MSGLTSQGIEPRPPASIVMCLTTLLIRRSIHTFPDEIDAVGQKRENSSKDMERRIVAQLLSCLDDLNKGCHQVMVVGATNKPDVLDPALRRAGR